LLYLRPNGIFWSIRGSNILNQHWNLSMASSGITRRSIAGFERIRIIMMKASLDLGVVLGVALR
jgi:hypothetical protein